MLRLNNSTRGSQRPDATVAFATRRARDRGCARFFSLLPSPCYSCVQLCAHACTQLDGMCVKVVVHACLHIQQKARLGIQ